MGLPAGNPWAAQPLIADVRIGPGSNGPMGVWVGWVSACWPSCRVVAFGVEGSWA